jgi:hypothetical protein
MQLHSLLVGAGRGLCFRNGNRRNHPDQPRGGECESEL